MGQRQLHRAGVELRVAQAEFTAAVAAPAPDVAVGVNGQPGVVGHRVVGIDAIFTPAGKRTCTGVLNEFSRLPSPSSPCVPRPQAYRLPSVSSAYSVEFEVPISATVPGRVTLTGELSMSTLPLVLPKNDPQCCSVVLVAGDVSAGEASADGVARLVADRVGTAAEDWTAVTPEEP